MQEKLPSINMTNLVKLLVISHCQQNVTWGHSTLLVVSCCIPSQFQYFSCKIYESPWSSTKEFQQAYGSKLHIILCCFSHPSAIHVCNIATTFCPLQFAFSHLPEPLNHCSKCEQLFCHIYDNVKTIKNNQHVHVNIYTEVFAISRIVTVVQRGGGGGGGYVFSKPNNH